jgi:pimeloyl-ACP methyl ester carboxylesterase
MADSGLSLNVATPNGTGQGRPIVALHGFLATLESWRGLVPLVPGRELWLFDLKGHGASPCPADGKYTVRDQADLVLAGIGNLRDVTLVGHSFGGGVALLVAIQLMKERRLARLVLVDALAFPEDLSTWAKWLRDFWLSAYLTVLPFWLSETAAVWAVGRGLQMLCEHPENITAASVAAYAGNLRQPARANALIQTGRYLVKEHYQEIENGLQDIKVPTLIVWGRDDPLVPPDPNTGKLLRGIQGSKLFVPNEACGHIAHEELPHPVLDEIAAFISAAPRGP